ncbi:MAG: hypothetical protein KJ749_13490 [Planctomycetes bacterium]|nr:hypothetical protein [Planctomycetota bacterium]
MTAMGFLVPRMISIPAFLSERVRFGLPTVAGPLDQQVLFILDGVGGLQFAPLLVRRVLRSERITMGTVVYKWQFGLPGEIWTDLMWRRRNEIMAVGLARRLMAFRRAHPQATIHVLAYSGGTGIAVFALERLGGREVVETLVLAGPAISPEYNLGPALQAVRRAYALISHRDTVILGWGTRVFGTMDREFVAAAGKTGFRIPPGAEEAALEAYGKLREVRWSPMLKDCGHHGGHTGWLTPAFLRRHLPSILEGNPQLPTRPVRRV